MGVNTNKYWASSNFGSKSIFGTYDVSGDMVSMSKVESAENSELSEIALNQIRLEAQDLIGCPFEALNKKYLPKEQYAADGLDNTVADSNQEMNIEVHPELPDKGGRFNQVIYPESVADAVPQAKLSQQQKEKLAEKRRKKQEKERKELSNKMKNKFKFRVAPKQAPKHRYVAPPPKHVPPKLRPPGG